MRLDEERVPRGSRVLVPVAQWIEPTFPKRVMRVRFSPGTLCPIADCELRIGAPRWFCVRCWAVARVRDRGIQDGGVKINHRADRGSVVVSRLLAG